MRSVIVSSLMLLMAGTAHAADFSDVSPTFTWSGAYVGVHAGYGWGNTRDTSNASAAKQDMDGFVGGAHIGYNWQYQNNLVLGTEADISFGSVSESWKGYTDPASPHSPYYGEDSIGVHGTLRARMGYAADRFMPYITGGLAWGHQKHMLGCDAGAVPAGSNGCENNALPNPGKFEKSASKTSVGWVVGAGAEYAVTDALSIRGEYLYTDYGSNDVSIVDPYYPAYSQRTFDTKFSTVRLGMSYKF